MDKNTSEIVKLTERISKDPKSKLFVPLAEEYKKAGDIDMAIQVLQEGLKNNPAYVTARSFLGRLLTDKGDLPGARKEFEEVVKAIPDNLMAHRKLGDIYALQDKPADALSHYKTAVSLNPKDADTAMLIAELEAGRDIKKHLPKVKPIAAEEPQKKQEPAPTSPSSAGKPQAASVGSKRPEPVQAATPKEEEAEEVLVVEPLDTPAQSNLEQELAASNMGFLAETADSPVFESREEEEKAGLFADGDPFAIGERAPGETAAGQEKPGEIPQAPATGPEKQADDFTTDTLAELYISQGFYEKAIDIYERMLVDKPNSQGLKDKLAKVRAMAEAAPAQKAEPEAASFKISAGLDPDIESGEAPAAETPSEFDAFVPPAAPDAPAQPDDSELPEARSIPVPDEDVPHPSQAPRQPKHFEVGFEPREYVPPDAVPRTPQKAADEANGRAAGQAIVKQAGEQKTAQPRKTPASKKETIERLEGWLKNIMKEN